MYNKVNALQFEFSGTYKIIHAANRKNAFKWWHQFVSHVPTVLQFKFYKFGTN